jgi:hypothetical protein
VHNAYLRHAEANLLPMLVFLPVVRFWLLSDNEEIEQKLDFAYLQEL